VEKVHGTLTFTFQKRISSLKNLVLIYFKFNPELIIISSGYDACIGCFEVSKFYFLLPGVNLKLITVLNIRGFRSMTIGLIMPSVLNI